MQKTWERYVRRVYRLCDPNFCRIFKTVLNESTRCADDVLKCVVPLLPDLEGAFPKSRRNLRLLIRNRLGSFWDNVTITKTIDLSHFQLNGIKTVKFSFIDPIFVWVQQCQRLHEQGHELIWRPKEIRLRGSTDPLFGSGIEYGFLFRQAIASIPQEGDVALMNLSWDSGATNMKSRSAVPICMQVFPCVCVCVFFIVTDT